MKSKNEENVMEDNQKESYCCRKQEGMDDWVAASTGARGRVKAMAQQLRVRAAVRTEEVEVP